MIALALAFYLSSLSNMLKSHAGLGMRMGFTNVNIQSLHKLCGAVNSVRLLLRGHTPAALWTVKFVLLLHRGQGKQCWIHSCPKKGYELNRLFISLTSIFLYNLHSVLRSLTTVSLPPLLLSPPSQLTGSPHMLPTLSLPNTSLSHWTCYR